MYQSRAWMVMVFYVLNQHGLTNAAENRAPSPMDFQRQIRPILSDKCFQCHGPDADSRQADLRLDDEPDLLRDRGGYRVLDRQRVQASELLRRITTTEAEHRMPPTTARKDLSEQERALLREWIEAGGSWAQHWAYVTPVRYAIPTIEHDTWSRNWIDAFLIKKWNQRQMTAAEEADATTLLRRLSLDLTGLPPSLDACPPQTEIEYMHLVDRLLASPAFGERMAVYWLDLVRYADTVGYHGDQDHNISPYRDYVIDAWNRNVPFDQFTIEQLAGDLLPNPSDEQRTASGYNRLLQTSHEGGVQPQEYLAIYGADRVRNVSAVWFGGTLGCAQCHDHKFDPYTTRDFYAMKAFFADLDEEQHFKVGGNGIPTKRPPEIPVLSYRERVQHEILAERASQLARDARGNFNQPAGADQFNTLQSRLQELEKSARLTMVSVAISPRVTRVLPRGNWMDQSGDVVEPAVPAFLGHVSEKSRRATRLDLARWLVQPPSARGKPSPSLSPESHETSPGVGLLTARVFVNRLWYLFFGRGLASNLDDFGAQGEPPAHEELLDRLAHEFVECGWDVKHLVRLMVTSSAYRQSSAEPQDVWEHDPENRWFARQSHWRLPAEMVRDTLLNVGDLLVQELGGGSVRPYQPDGYYKHLNFPERTYQSHLDRRQWRRGVYMHWQRQFLHPMLKAFDAPSREECTVERSRSNTPLAALTLLNDPSCVEAARGLALRTLRECPAEDSEARAQFAFRAALGRPADSVEVDVMLRLYQQSEQQLEHDPSIADRFVAVGISPVPAGTDRVSLALWTTVCRALLNLDETITRN